jgi:hypothetical protein
MPAVPKRRHVTEELPGVKRSQRQVGISPNAAFAKKVMLTDLPLSVGNWLLTLLVLAIPILNVILYAYWAFFTNGNKGRINFCRTSLILMLAGLIIAFGATAIP